MLPQGLWWDMPAVQMLPGVSSQEAAQLANKSLGELPMLLSALQNSPAEAQRALWDVLRSDAAVNECLQVRLAFWAVRKIFKVTTGAYNS